MMENRPKVAGNGQKYDFKATMKQTTRYCV